MMSPLSSLIWIKNLILNIIGWKKNCQKENKSKIGSSLTVSMIYMGITMIFCYCDMLKDNSVV